MTSHVSIETGQLNRPTTGMRCQKRSGRPMSTMTNIRHIIEHGDREQLAEHDDVVQRVVVVDVRGDDEHDRRGRHADEVREVRDVRAPRDLVDHVGRRRGPTLSWWTYATTPSAIHASRNASHR